MAKNRLRALPHRHLIGLEDYSREEIGLILDTADSFKEVIRRPIRKVPALRGKNVVNLFFESSTRTRLSFELAEKQLSADTLNFASSGSSVSKGESLSDTARNIEAMQVDCVVVRHAAAGAPLFLSQCLSSAVVINAGDGAHEHPTQGLLDLLTMRDALGRLEGLKVALVGDIAHSRVARSNIWGLRKMGADVVVCGPPTLIPVDIEEMGVEVCYRLEDAPPRSRRGLRPADTARTATGKLSSLPSANTRGCSASTPNGWNSPSPTPSSCIPAPSTAAWNSTAAWRTAGDRSFWTR